MSGTPNFTSKPFQEWQKLNDGADFLQLKGPDGSVKGWIDSAGSTSGVLGASTSPQLVSSAAFPGGTIPTGITGTIIFFGSPTAFTFTGSSPFSKDGQRLAFFVFSGGPFSISGAAGTFAVPIMGLVDTLTFPSAGTGAIFEYRGGALFYIGGGGFTPSLSGISGPRVGYAVDDFYLNASADGALNFSGGITPLGSAFITKGSAAALTLINPGVGGDDGKTLTVISTTAFAHTITTAANGINSTLHIATFGAAVANFITFKAFNGTWWVIGSTGVALT